MANLPRDSLEKKAGPGKPAASSKAAWIVVGLMLLAIGGMLAYNPRLVTDWFGGGSNPQPDEAHTGGQTSELGFLTIEGPAGARVTLDGELLGELPLSNRVVRAGPHRLVIKDPAGKVLLDRKLTVTPGGQERITIGAPPR